MKILLVAAREELMNMLSFHLAPLGFTLDLANDPVRLPTREVHLDPDQRVEELDAVLGVGERQLLGVVALAVAGLAQDLGGGLGQRPLVGDGYSQQGHGWSLRGGRRRRRARCPWRA